MNYEKIIKELGFVFTETQIITPIGSEFDNQDVHVFTNNRTQHQILIWPRNQFSMQELATTIRTMIIPFDNVMKFYFENITKQ